MKIFNSKIDKALQIYRQQELKKKVDSSSRLNKKDNIKISDKGKDFQFAMKLLKDVPDVRKEKIDEIKQQLRTGTYKIDSGKIVEKIFENINIDEKI
jgi:negative regulator of flagellin synthesis FlgM